MRLVDGLRGIAALWVVLFHLYMGGHLGKAAVVIPGLAAFCRVGTLGVYIFFVLSGFVIAHSVGKHQVTGAFVGRFALRRSLRLDPPYWASMLLVGSLAFLHAKLRLEPVPWPSLGRVGAHLLYAQDILGIQPISVVYWTLCLEIQFYLLFCLLLWVAHRTGKHPLAVFAPALAVAGLWPLLGLPWPWPGSFIPYWYGFLSGMLANWGMRGLVRWWAPVGFAAILFLAALRTWFFRGNAVAGLEVATAARVAVLLFWAGRSGAVTHWLSWRFLQVLGAVSYSLYLIHVQALDVFYAVVKRVFGEAALHDWRYGLVAVAATVAAAWIFWRLIELPLAIMAGAAPYKDSDEEK